MADPSRRGLIDTARAWLAVEPDEDIRRELEGIMAEGGATLERTFAGSLTFGTAGLRAPIGAGPMKMNRIVIRQAAAGFVDHLLQSEPSARERGILIGFDARHKSRSFAEDTARVAAARGMRAMIFDRVVPTPILAWNIVGSGAAGAVMVTASHNPASDNGYKVYRSNGAQIVSPTDVRISESIRRVDPLSVELSPMDSPMIEFVGNDEIEEYLRWIPSVRLRPESTVVPVAYTAMHGVGGDYAVRALERSGFARPVLVSEQHQPDPDFPTVAFPNPEEPGAMDRVVDTARLSGCSLALANDPDADRLGVAIVDHEGRWRRLSGDEIGWLMADHILRWTSGNDRLVVTTLVSSSLLGKMARACGVAYEETYTGFKWIASAVERHPDRRLIFAYEQALGYLVAPQPLDKDGLSAAVLMTEIAAVAAEQGVTLEDRLDDIAERFGRHVTVEASVRMPPSQALSSVERLLSSLPRNVVGRRVMEVIEFREAALVRLMLEGRSGDPIRIQVRPSGTEPKVKIYAEAVGENPEPYLGAVAEFLT